MVPTSALPFALVPLATVGVGVALLLRVERALDLQEAYAERFGTVTPSETPGYYQQTREWRRQVLQVGGGVLVAVGLLLLVVVVSGVLFAP